MEHARNDTHQFADTDMYMVWDKFEDKPLRAFRHNAVYGTYAEALDYLTNCGDAWPTRRIAVKLSCIAAFPINEAK